jgi:L-alanine-DL-glutamate epimerase-like enolase superfamily enzyme
MSRQLSVNIERFPIAGKFTIARGAKTEAIVVAVTLTQQKAVGRGECVPYARYGETPESVVAAIESARSQIELGIGREALQSLMPAGAARNAVDSALWDLEAKLTGVHAYVTAGLDKLTPATTAYTISLDTAEKMAEMARKASDRPILKIKLGAPEGDLSRIRAVRLAAPRAILIADANEGWTETNIDEHLSACFDAKYSLVEQPLPATKDEVLRNVSHKVPLCADESVHDRAGLKRLVGLYDIVNIKLDKTGGLTEALALAREAQTYGFGLMIGCMVGTSLGMAPALILAAQAKFVDLDGPLLLAHDRQGGLVYEGSLVHPPSSSLWG